MTLENFAGEQLCTMKELIGCSINSISLGCINNNCNTHTDCNDYDWLRFSTDKGNIYYVVCTEYDDCGWHKISGVEHVLNNKIIDAGLGSKYPQSNIELTTPLGKAQFGYWGSTYYEQWINHIKEDKVDKNLMWIDVMKDWKSV